MSKNFTKWMETVRVEYGVSDNLTKLILTGLALIACGSWMFLTSGQSGIGWFVFCLFIIWG